VKTVLKILGGLAILAVVLVASGFIYIQSTWERDYSTVPLPPITATTDSAVIARGEYVVHALAHCSACHALAGNPEANFDTPLSGGYVWDIPLFGTFAAANITSDAETGIGRLSDGEIARAIRHNVGADGRFLPFMRFSVGPMSDEDLTAVVSWLRAQPAVSKAVPRDEWGILAKALASRLAPRTDAPPPHIAGGVVSVERGKYLAEGPAACALCHTPTDQMTFATTGPVMSGNGVAEPDGEEAGFEFVSPNLTFDPTTGHIAAWTEDQFVARMRQGRVYKGSKMPWENFTKMSEEDARSVYRYLRSLPPAVNNVGPPRRRAGEGPTS